MIENQQSEYLRFVRDPAYKGKTQVWSVASKTSGETLGTIRWWGAWRQYVFVPFPRTLYNTGCMEDIVKAVKTLNDAWRKEHHAKRKMGNR